MRVPPPPPGPPGSPGTPNPGSPQAKAAGCTCPVAKNNRGRKAPEPPRGWWQDIDCPIHPEPELKT